MKLLLKRAMLFWLTGAIAVVVAMVSFSAHSATVSAAPKEEAPLECLRCHTRVLKDHDQLGRGSDACWACHDGRTMGMLRLPDGTQLPLANSNQLCGECHSEHYVAWKKDKHGVLARRKEKPEALGARKPKCVGCHSAHQPKIKLSKGTVPLPSPSPGLGGPLDCLSCHARILEGHDKLGSGSKACWACHYNMEMGVFHLAAGEQRLQLPDYPQLCAQCHQTRYQDWLAGTHGIPSWEVGTVDVHGAQRVGCNGCHDPHQPRVSFSNITLPHPSAQTPAAPPSFSLLALFGTALLLAIGAGVAMFRKGEWP
ncbi:MAG: hypothetical protein A2156_05305 [Deltaproteobacteria bacterium RBG_16_48_10]|nr:MAG: hypothetical protein A2156_05305 [Deltaproteobacteria bacterium RBG_16_48_10]